MRNPIAILNKFYGRLLNLFVLIILFVLFSIFGLMFIENMTFLESFWTVTNIITTVGSQFRGYYNLSVEGRIFILFIMWVGIFIFLMAVTIIASDLLQGKYQKAFKLYNMEKKLSALSDHVIICGFGRNGRQAARKLQKYNRKFVIIDIKEIEKYSDGEFENAILYQGDATLDSTLETCGIARSAALITAMPSDANNLFAVITARQMNPKLKIISRASDSHSINKLKMAGADNVIMPDKIGGEHMASLVVTPDLVEFVDQVNFEGNENRNLVEMPTNQVPEAFLGKTLEHYLESLETRCKIIGYKNKEGLYLMNPDADQLIEKNEFIIFFGRNSQIESLKKSLNLK